MQKRKKSSFSFEHFAQTITDDVSQKAAVKAPRVLNLATSRVGERQEIACGWRLPVALETNVEGIGIDT